MVEVFWISHGTIVYNVASYGLSFQTSTKGNIHICFSLCGLNCFIPQPTAHHPICYAQLFLLNRTQPIHFHVHL